VTRIQDNGVDHGGFDFDMSQELLDCTNIISILEEMGHEALAEE
jgi:hypothetical protein